MQEGEGRQGEEGEGADRQLGGFRIKSKGDLEDLEGSRHRFWTGYGQVPDNITQSGRDVRAAVVSPALHKALATGIECVSLISHLVSCSIPT